LTHIAIIGSRHYPNPGPVTAYVSRLPADAVVISGGARGVDSIAERAASARGLETLIFRADWKRLGRRAEPIRNAQIVALANSVAAFWDGASRGTLNTVVLALREGLPVEIYDVEGEPVPLDHALRIAEERGVLAAIDAAESQVGKT
jgi:predicted Rossmann fold nucleotide-binding protein DprA/Smf involved in DNA uptake